MRRSVFFYDAPASTNDWLFRFLVVLGTLVLALALAATAMGAMAYFSFEGAFTNGSETQSSLFNTNAAMRPPSEFELRTWQYDGAPVPPGNTAGDGIEKQQGR
jgi:hypothetical protein